MLRIFISSTDRDRQQLLYESLVLKAKEAGLKGATVLKGVLGYGASSVIHSYRFWEVTEKLPVVVEIVDDDEKVNAFYESVSPLLESMRYGCLITKEAVDILLYKKGSKSD